MWVQNFAQRYKKKHKFPNIFTKKYARSPELVSEGLYLLHFGQMPFTTKETEWGSKPSGSSMVGIATFSRQ